MKKILVSISMLALALGASANVPVIKSDAKVEAQVEQTLQKLTLEEKVGQMMELVSDLFGANDKNGVFYIDEKKTDSILSRYKVGSILNAPNTCAPRPISGRQPIDKTPITTLWWKGYKKALAK